MIEINKHRLSFPAMLTSGFIAIILTGTFLLMLPIASRSGRVTPLIDALFTATSATCVTGMSTLDTATYWSLFGQVVISLMMEVGGLGFMTFIVVTGYLAKQRVQMSTKILAQESLGLTDVSQISLIMIVVKLSLAIQMLGAGLLMVDLVPRYGWLKGIWFSIFHSMSAFCNAGFDLFGNSLTKFRHDPYILVVFAILIISGSLGFIVWRDLLQYHRKKHLTLHTKLSLYSSVIILALSFCIYAFTERDLWVQSGSFIDKVVDIMFLAVAPRTAGFYFIPYNTLSVAGIVFTIVLMFIGGTPGSTAGGVKTTTVGLLILQSWATLKGREEVTFSHRRFTRDDIHKALTLLTVSIIFVVIAILVLSSTQILPQSEETFKNLLFEAVSAFGTAGITLDVTANLNTLGKIIIMFLMFVGRVGVYTVMNTVLNASEQQKKYHYPKEEIIIG